MIIVNGLPKSGTHAVMAWLSRMGLKRSPGVIAPSGSGLLLVHGCDQVDLDALRVMPDNVFAQAHVPADLQLDGFSVITIFRDPRNVLVSYVRHQARWGKRNLTISQALDDFWGDEFVPTYARYLGWQGRSIVVRYEDMAPEHIGSGNGIYDPNRPASDRWIGNTRTGNPSDWRQAWSEETEHAWQEAHGPELLIRAGYGKHPIERRLAA